MTELDLDAIKRSLVVNRDSQNGWASRVVEDLVAEVERLKEHIESRERALRREEVMLLASQREVKELRAVTARLAENVRRGDFSEAWAQTFAEKERIGQDAEDAEKGAAACDQMIALLDGFPVSDQGVEAERVAALLDEVRHLRAQRVLDNEEAARLYDFARDKGAALERDATVAYLLKGTADCKECMDEAVVRLAREIERGDHRREEKP